MASVGAVGEVIALFPLSAVLLPGMPLPLHIFEQRYRQLLDDLADAPGGARFGVVALRSGSETLVGEGADDSPDLAQVGTLAEIVEVQRKEDGSSDVLSVGSRRFHVESLIADGKPYLRAQVRFLAEDDGALDDDRADHARQLMTAYDTLLARLAGRATGGELPTDPSQLGYQIAARLPLLPADRQSLLEIETTAERLAGLNRMLRREIALLRHTRTIAVAPAVLRLVDDRN
jgi:Lon protease-like protein